MAKQFIAERNAVLLNFLGLRASHQPRKIDAPFVITGCVRRLDITELGLKAEMADLLYIFGFYFLRIDFGVLTFSAIVVDASNILGKLPQNLTHMRQSAHRLNTRSQLPSAGPSRHISADPSGHRRV